MDVTEIGLDEWATQLPASGFEPFHRPEVLDVLDTHASGDLELYGGFKGDHLVAMAPVFVRRSAVGRAVTSPPPSMGVPRLGPLVMPNSPKRRKREKVTDRFVEGLLDAVDAADSRTLFRLVCGTAFGDPRPFVWRDLDVEPLFTYRLAVGDRDLDSIRSGFSKDLRKDVRRRDEVPVTVSEGGREEARAIYDLVAARYREQDKDCPLTWPFVADVVEAFDERAKVYVARGKDGAVRNGLLVVYSNDAAYTWQGGTADACDGVSTNSLLQWRAIEDLVTDPPVESADTYDLTGANTKHLSGYKSAYGGDLVSYYTVESSGATMSVAKKAYQFVGD